MRWYKSISFRSSLALFDLKKMYTKHRPGHYNIVVVIYWVSNPMRQKSPAHVIIFVECDLTFFFFLLQFAARTHTIRCRRSINEMRPHSVRWQNWIECIFSDRKLITYVYETIRSKLCHLYLAVDWIVTWCAADLTLTLNAKKAREREHGQVFGPWKYLLNQCYRLYMCLWRSCPSPADYCIPGDRST